MYTSSSSSLAVLFLSVLVGCSKPEDRSAPNASPVTSNFCATPGSIFFDENGRHVVAGGSASTPDLAWLTLPAGFCAHHFAVVPTARQIRFAPGGELFVASPSSPTTGGGIDGLSSIVVVPDDDHDGVGDAVLTYRPNMGSTQGLLFVPGWFYYQQGTQIRRFPYEKGDRVPSGPSELLADVMIYVSTTHWPKTLDVADDGTIYIANGGDQGEICTEPHPFHGGILELDGSQGGKPIVKGLRNPIVVRCQRGHNHCFALELARDYSDGTGGREKLFPIHEGDDWGFPCCATKDLPFPDDPIAADCSGVTEETNSFVIGNTPFGLDFAPASWPASWAGNAMVTLHGDFGSWHGARLLAIATDPATGMPLPSSTLDGGSGAVTDFATGWDDDSHLHGRPGDLTFAPDGRLFVADDVKGEIFWIAHITSPLGDGGDLPDGSVTVDAGPISDVHGPPFDGNLGCASASVSLAADVGPIFERACSNCHAPPVPDEKLDLSPAVAWASLVPATSRQCGGRPLVAPGNPDGSYLFDKLQGQNLCTGTTLMPPSGDPLSQDELTTIRNWICMGAPDN